MPVAGSIFFGNFIMKSMVTSYHNSSNSDIVFCGPYFACVEYLFYWQFLHFFTYAHTVN